MEELEETATQLKTQKLDRNNPNYREIRNKALELLRAINQRRNELLVAQVSELKVEAKQFPLPKAHGLRQIYRMTLQR